MAALGDDPKITSMAHALGIHHGDRVTGIKEFCRAKVRKIVADSSPVNSIDDLERTVCEKLHVEIVEIWTDQDLDALIEQRARHEKDIAFAALRRDLDKVTFTTLIRRKQRPGETTDHYVAVIDCRGEKAARRFFTRWHEIAHVLTLFEQLQLPLHRSTTEKDAIERMMDLIAGDIGFYEPLFLPLLTRELAKTKRLTFSAVNSVRSAYSPTASFEATLNACVSRAEMPVLLLHGELKHKRSIERALAAGQFEMFPSATPAPQLRVVSCIPNDAAKAAGLAVRLNMRVPEKSVIFTAFERGEDFEIWTNSEDLDWWSTSDGEILRSASVQVETMRVKEQVWALLTLV